ncbi:MAG: tetratricopeptide repeat protein [Desulfococcaceae bacterium]
MAVFFRHSCGLLTVLAMVFLCIPAAWAQSERLQTGIEAVQAENYEEAVPILETARQENPDASLAAFFLGMAYKGAARFPDALDPLRDAVTLTPRIKDALIELIDLLLILSAPEHLTEAEKWIGIAEADQLYPARIAFLKGRLLKKQEEFDAAAEAFEQAKSLDPDLAQTADYQIALSRLRIEEYDKAKDAFRRVIDRAPDSDLADFARKYHDLTEDRLFAQRDLRITLTLLGQYDTNMVLRPTDDTAAVGITDEEGFTTTDVLSLEYLPDIDGPVTFYGQYAAILNLHQDVGDTHDIIGNTVTLQPGYTLNGWSLSLKGPYTHYLRRNPD